MHLAAVVAIAAIMLLAQLPHRRRYWCDHRALVVHTRRDLALTIVAVLLSISSVQLMARKALAYRGVTAGEQVPLVGQINPVDRIVAGRWDTDAKRSGRIFKTTAMYLVPAALLLGAGSVRRRLVLLWVYVQGSVITDSVTGITKGLVERLRPFAYVDNATMLSLDPDSRSDLLEDLASPDVYNAFFSGDASITAFGLLYFALVYRRYTDATHPRALVLALSLIGVALGILFRTLSGKHFPSDVLAGGAVGLSVAWSVVRLHEPAEVNA